MKGIRLYHVFHLFVGQGKDERSARLLSHSQANNEYLKDKEGLLWSIPTSILDDPEFRSKYPDHEKWIPRDWLYWAVVQGYKPKKLCQQRKGGI